MELSRIERESYERVRKKLEKSRRNELANFKAKEHASLDVMPYADNEIIFWQQGRRVSWGRKNGKYVSARHYANADCAKEIIDELVKLGAKQVYKEDERPMELF